jgi:hypothetical protein
MKRSGFVVLLLFILLALLTPAYRPRGNSQGVTQIAVPIATATLAPVATPTVPGESKIDEPKLDRILQLVEMALQTNQSTASVAESTLERINITVTLGVAIVGGLAILSGLAMGLFTYRRAESAEEMAEHAKQAAEEAEGIAEESMQNVECSIEAAQEMLSEAQQEAIEYKETLSIARRDLDSLRTSMGRIEATLDRFEVITGKDPEGRLRAAQRLTQSADPSVIPTLFFLLSTDEDPRVREAAAYGLGFRKESTASELLVERSEKEGDSYVRKRCIWALGEIADPGDEATIRQLGKIAKADPDPEVRKAAEEALKKALGAKE